MRRVLAALAVLAACVTPAWAQQVAGPHVVGELHSARAAVAPGERFTIVLRQRIEAGWHTYWRNPGVSGEPPHVVWRAPRGFSVGELQWPTPVVLPLGTLVNYGYSGDVLLPIDVTAPADARPGTIANFQANVDWLVCSDTTCIPEQTSLVLNLPVAPHGRDDPEWTARIAQAVAALPKRERGVEARIAPGGQLSIALVGAEQARDFTFFAFDRDAVRASAPQHPRVGAGGVSFTLTAGADANLGQTPVTGVLAYETQDGTRRGVEIEATPGSAVVNTDTRAAIVSNDYPLASLERGGAAAPSANLSLPELLAAAALAFLGGLILNLMPCVLPVLAVKALSLADGAQRGGARQQGGFYFAGAMTMFITLAVILIALRAGGDAVGWGFQLQAPWATSALALLFFAIGLNMLDVFSFGVSVNSAQRGGDAGAFFTGALAVVTATPCTAPFMAGAIGVALTQSAGATLLIFGALGLGFALPLTLLHFAPGLQRLIPKPGAWMERLRHVLAFPMFGAAAWLAWVLTQQTGSDGMLALLSLAAALGFALMVAKWGRVWLIAGALVFILTLAFAWRPLTSVEARAALTSESWSVGRVAALRAEGRPVFVNFTAAWCITCQVNEISTLERSAVAAAFARAHVAYLKADWTNQDADIAAALAEQGRAGVPLYLFYPASGGEPVVLPQILSEQAITDVIAAHP